MTSLNDFRVLCLSFHAPPAIRPQAVLIGKMIPEWLRQGLRPVLVTYDTGREWKIDAPVYHVRPRSVMFARLVRLPLVGRPLERLALEASYRRIAAVIRRHRINLVYSFAKPHESNLLAAMIRNRLGVPAIAHFSDPIYEAPYGQRSPKEAREALAQERAIIGSCDRTIFIAEELKDLTMKKFPTEWARRARVVPHCFDPADYPDEAAPDPAAFTISHVGVFRKGRDPRPLFVALSSLIKRRPELERKLVVNFVGSLNVYSEFTEAELKAMIGTYGLEGIVRAIPSVPFRESLAFMRRSDCLVAIDLDIPKCPYILSKVFDYAGSGRPILGIMQDDNPTAVFLRRAGYASFSHGQAEELSRCLEEMIDGRRIFRPNAGFIEQFTVRQTTELLISLFREVLDNPTTPPILDAGSRPT